MRFAIPGRRAPLGASEQGARENDALALAADAGLALLRRPGVRTGPVAFDMRSGRLRLLVPAGSADELPGREADRVDLVRLVGAAATECHRARLRRTARMSRAQPLAFS
jgi:hypothetical protein